MFNIVFFGTLLGTFAGIIAGTSLLSYILKKEMDKISKETMKNCILGYTIIQYED
jgi:hypothetical protein